MGETLFFHTVVVPLLIRRQHPIDKNLKLIDNFIYRKSIKLNIYNFLDKYNFKN